jgi:hypothetical protein
MKKIINLWGGPGTGKTTTASELFVALKKLGYNVEMNREYIKDWVWEKRELKEGDQSYLLTKQARKERIYMLEDVDFIISDCPVGMIAAYGMLWDLCEKHIPVCWSLYRQHEDFAIRHGYQNINFFLKRTKTYNPKGRYQTEEVADQVSSDLERFHKAWLKDGQILDCDEKCTENILAFLKLL